MKRNIGNTRALRRNVAVACGCLWLVACGGKVVGIDDVDDGSETGGSGGSEMGGSGGIGGSAGYAGGYGGSGAYAGGGYGGSYGGSGGYAGGYGGSYGGSGGYAGGYGGSGAYAGGGYGGSYGGSGGYAGGIGGYAGGIGGYAGGTGGYGGTQCPLSTNDPQCDNCFQHVCEYECVGMMSIPTTNDYLTCLQGCYDQSCMNGCEAQYPGAAAALNKLEACIQTQCPYACGYNNGDCALTTGMPECDSCFHTVCNYECVAAINEPSFMNFLDCYQYCSDQACADACEAQYPSASAALWALTGCMDANCINECGPMN